MPYPTPEVIPSALTGRLLLIPNDYQIIQTIWGALLDLTYESNWQQIGAVTPAQIAFVMEGIVDAGLDDVPALVGMIFPIITSFPPQGALLCDGSSYLRITYPDLYAALDPAFVIDANTFFVPDLRGRTIITAGTGSGLTPRSVGAILGEETHILVSSEIPSHTHVDAGHTHATTPAAPNATTIGAGAPQPTAIPSVGITGIGSASLSSVGGNGAHNNMQPSLALKYAVWTQ